MSLSKCECAEPENSQPCDYCNFRSTRVLERELDLNPQTPYVVEFAIPEDPHSHPLTTLYR